MKNLKFALPLTLHLNTYFVIAELRFLKKRPELCSLSTDMQYNPILDHELYNEYLSEDTAKQILFDLGFFEVKDNFDGHSIEDLREIKDKLSGNWVELYNLSANYTG